MRSSRIAGKLSSRLLARSAPPLPCSRYASLGVSQVELTPSQIRSSSTAASLVQDPTPASQTQLEATQSQLFITWPNGRQTALYVLSQLVKTEAEAQRPSFLVRSLQMPEMLSRSNETATQDLDGCSS
jgi:hypothetical protein